LVEQLIKANEKMIRKKVKIFNENSR